MGSIRNLSDLGNRSENSAGRGQILSILQGNSCSVDQKSGGIWTVQTDLQQIYPESDRLLVLERSRNGFPARKCCLVHIAVSDGRIGGRTRLRFTDEACMNGLRWRGHVLTGHDESALRFSG
jgi:hypothetical protein